MGVWALFLPQPYEYAIIAAIAVPVIAIIILKLSNGLMRIDKRKGSAYPSIFWGVFTPSMALCLRAFDFNIFDYSNVWPFSILMTLALTAFLGFSSKEFKLKKAADFLMLIGISLFAFAYSYGSVLTLNGIYDYSDAKLFNAKILSKRIDSGKSTTYYLELTPWGPQKETEEVSVPEDLYNAVKKDDKVTICLKKGNFDIPWFIVRE